ncbi:MAG: signal peptidase II [Pseudomonadota bacterium]
MPQRFRLVCSLAAIIVVLDQATKWLVEATIPFYGTVEVLPFFDLVHIHNRGAAFGFLNRSDIEWQFWLFFVATIFSVGAIMSIVRSVKQPMKGSILALMVALGSILGGAIGNFIDRVRYRAVVDFLDFYIGHWHWPAFNVADIAICVGACLAILAIWRNPSIIKDI